MQTTGLSATSWKPILLMLACVLAGFAIRLPGLADPPLDFHATRQYRAAIIARGYAVDLLRDWNEASRRAAEIAASAQPPIEPPFMERIAAALYRVIGREDLAWARGASVVAWSLGGLAMAWLAAQLVSPSAAIAAVALWTFLPFSIRASQAFQPDPLMTALLVFTVATGVRFVQARNVAAGILFLCGVAATLTVKAVAAFFLAPAVLVLLLGLETPWRTRILCALLTLAAVSPAAWYYSQLPLSTDYGPFVELLSQQRYWRGWQAMVGRVVWEPTLIAAVIGAMGSRGLLRRLLCAWLVGYAAFGIVFTHHIYTHDYYSLPLIPIAALGVAALLQRTVGLIGPRGLAALSAAVCVAAVAVGALTVVEAKRPENTAALAAEAARYEQIGRVVEHNSRVVSLDGAYGFALSYHGRLWASNMLLSGDLDVLKLAGQSAPPPAERLRQAGGEFFVGTVQAELEAQPELKATLSQQHPLIARDGDASRWDYVVYDLRRGIISATPQHVSLFSRIGEPAPPAQTVALYAPPQTSWRVLPSAPVVQVSPASGTGPAVLSVTTAAATEVVDRTIPVNVSGSATESTTFDVRIRAVAGANTPPFGFVDAPPDPVSLGDAPILLQGWALDDTAMKRVWVGYLGSSGKPVVLGEATRDGHRPDVANAFPTAHDLFKAAWAFTLDPATLKAVSRPIKLLVFAEDASGLQAVIGERTVR